ncbi:MAG TPA: LysE family transporter [Candidatus Blautia faecavium]|uniref:LysE family transporter n=1 Tax=Candidatus Blautia faecavium TaxID=2838487 RepID=A0A9D2RV99_9FIRM|nr:LysE family transporter [Candidatus Blautia faecavium]
MEYWLRGILIGLLFGLPVGAIGTLTIQRTWNLGAKAGLLTGLGSSAADCFYACAGAFGLTLISDFLLRFQEIITALGGALVLAMGLKSLIRPQEELPPDKEAPGGAKLFLTTFAIGITNPTAILTFLFAFSYFGISEIRGWKDGILLVTGVFLGTYFWWGTLSALTQFIKRRAVKFQLRTMNRIFGGILCSFGILVYLRLLL